ncbi:MAG: hypothetical protein GY859_25295 [Desulfobacterales bacterium]|nr:hypothetical protein [Desulfobacterales bacterium]
MENATHLEEVEKALQNYSDALSKLETAAPESRVIKAGSLDILFARDALQSTLESLDYDKAPESETFIEIDAKVDSLDAWLQKRAKIISENIDLLKWRTRLNPQKRSWWWWLKPKKTIQKWDRFDWVWNLLTMVFLGLSASFMVNIYKALSVGSLTVGATFSAIAQVGGLAVISQGALTQRGQEKTRELLGKLNIPSRFQSEATMLLAIILLGTIYYSHGKLQEHYDMNGHKYYQEGRLGLAELTLLKGLQIDPVNVDYKENLGRIYESIGLQDKATEQYYFNVTAGELAGINDLGRTLINKKNQVTFETDPKLAAAFLMMGLQRADSNEHPDQNLKYQLNRNLGWALMEAKKFDQAEKYLKEAIALDEKIHENQMGGGMAYCFLANAYDEKAKAAGAGEAQGDVSQLEEDAQKNWKECVEKARPETVMEFKWFMRVARDDVAYFIDTSKIISGLDRNAYEQKKVYQEYLNSIGASEPEEQETRPDPGEQEVNESESESETQ